MCVCCVFYSFAKFFRFQVLLDEMKAREIKCEQVCERGKLLVKAEHPLSTDINARINSLQFHLKTLQELAESRRKQLEDSLEAYQVSCDDYYIILLPYVFIIL